MYITEVNKPCYDRSVVRFIGKIFLCVYMYMYIQVEKILHYVLYQVKNLYVWVNM